MRYVWVLALFPLLALTGCESGWAGNSLSQICEARKLEYERLGGKDNPNLQTEEALRQRSVCNY